MTATTEAPRAAAPWHLWVVGIVGVLWNGYACYDYFMTKTQGTAYLKSSGMTDAQVAHMAGYPVWMSADWAIGVWGGLLAAVLLLARMRYAFHVFALSLAAFVVMLAYSYLMTNGGEIYGSQGLIMNGVILAGCLFFTWYAWTMTKRGVLR